MPKRKISGPEPYELDEATAERLEHLTAAADHELADERVGIRWRRASLDVVRQAAEIAGVAYQTYVKQVAFRQALTDLKDAKASGVLAAEKPTAGALGSR